MGDIRTAKPSDPVEPQDRCVQCNVPFSYEEKVTQRRLLCESVGACEDRAKDGCHFRQL